MWLNLKTPLKLSAIVIFFVSNFFGLLMTAYGLLIVGLLPTTAFLSQLKLSYLLASVLYGALLTMYFTFSNSFYKESVKFALILLPFITVLALISAYFSFVSIVFESSHKSSINSLVDKLKTIDEKIMQADDYITEVYLRQIKTLERLADDSKKGLDETGIPKCGSLCKKYLRMRASLIEKYSALDIKINGLPNQSDPNEVWKMIQGRYAKFLEKKSLFEAFANEARLEKESSEFDFSLVFQEIQKVFSGKDSITPIVLIMRRVNEFIVNRIIKWQGSEDISLYLFLVIACIPELVNVGLSLTLIVLGKGKSISELKKEVQEKKEKYEWERNLSSMEHMHKLWQESFDMAKNTMHRN